MQTSTVRWPRCPTLKLGGAMAVIALGIVLVFVPPAHAGGVVSPCDEVHLLLALASGGLVTFDCDEAATITLTATVTISKNTTIDGSGQNVTISGGNTVGVFMVTSGTTLSLNRITIANGLGGTLGGGAISNPGGTVTVTNCTFSGNNSYYGGAIANGGTMTVTNSTFSGNHSSSGGGGIDNGGTLTVSNSTFFGNSVGPGGQFIGGGAISNFGTSSVTGSTFNGNSVVNSGGGSVARGGAIWNVDAPLTIKNTIVANSASGGNCANSGTLTDGGGNLDTDGTCGVTTVTPANLNLDSVLRDNGGHTQTLALLPGSAAIGAAVEVNCPISDQRGFPRPFTSACSSGAYEPGTLFKSFHINGDATYYTSNSFALGGTFTLGADTTDIGINPPNDVVQLRFGTFTAVISPGSFGRVWAGSFAYSRATTGGATFQMTIQPLGGSQYAFRASARGPNIMAGTTSPIIVQLNIGDDGGTTHAPANSDDD